MDSTFTLALVTGQSVTDVSQNVMANLGWDEVRLPAPVFEGDTIYSESEVLVGARLDVAAERRRRHRGHDRLQPGRRDRHHLQAHAARLPPRPRSRPLATASRPWLSWADVVAIAWRFPGIVEGTSYGTPSLKVRDKFLCRLRTNPDALVIRVIDVGDQEALLLGQPGRVLQDAALRQRARTCSCGWRRSSDEQLAELIEDAWRTQAPKRLIAAFDKGE